MQLTYTFPEDARTSNGASFWSPPKRFPKPVVFDPADEAHASYMQSSAILLAEVYGIARPSWAAERAAVAEKAAAIEVRTPPVSLFFNRFLVGTQTPEKEPVSF